MIAHHGEGAGQAGEHALPPVVDLGGLAVHDMPSADDVAAEGLADALVAQADAEDRDLAGEAFDGGQRDTRFVGRAGSGREYDARRGIFGDLVGVDLVVAVDPYLFAQLAEVLHQVVGEGVVVVDHEQHDGLNLLARLGSASNEHPGYPPGNPPCSLGYWLDCTGSAGFDGIRMGQGRAGNGTA